MMPELTIRALARAEMHLPVSWAAREGWNPGRHDADAFHSADPHGFLVGELDGAPVSTISAVRADGFGFVGFYITDPAHRRRGFGLQLWRAALARLAGTVVGLDGVVAQQAGYARSGFVLAHRNIRHGGLPALPRHTAPDPTIVPAASLDPAALLAFDTAHFGFPRPAFLDAWLHLPDSLALARVRDDRLHAFGVIRHCHEGCKIGPLFATSPADAEALFLALAAFAPGEHIFLDTPEPNPAAAALALRHGLTPVFETARMYLGPAPDLPLRQIFGITTFELG